MTRARSAWLLLVLPAACSQDPGEPRFEPECKVNQFRACETEDCLGAQQCVEPGAWDRCFCTVLDASYADAGASDADASAGDSAPE